MITYFDTANQKDTLGAQSVEHVPHVQMLFPRRINPEFKSAYLPCQIKAKKNEIKKKMQPNEQQLLHFYHGQMLSSLLHNTSTTDWTTTHVSCFLLRSNWQTGAHVLSDTFARCGGCAVVLTLQQHQKYNSVCPWHVEYFVSFFLALQQDSGSLPAAVNQTQKRDTPIQSAETKSSVSDMFHFIIRTIKDTLKTLACWHHFWQQKRWLNAISVGC